MLLNRRSLLLGLAATPCAALPSLPTPNPTAHVTAFKVSTLNQTARDLMADTMRWLKDEPWKFTEYRPDAEQWTHSYVREQSPDVADPVAGRTLDGV